MIVTLNRKQRVSVSSRIRFQHCADSGRRHEVEVNEKQFRNLDDAIVNLDKYHSVRYFPLGGSLWLFQKDATTKLIDNCNRTFFWFYEQAWRYYITHVHNTLYAFICHGKPFHRQSYAKYESRLYHTSGRSVSHISRRHKTLSRSPRNAHHEDVKRSQHTNVSRWKGADSRTRVRRRSRKHASRTHHEIKTDQLNAAITSDENDSIKSSDQCSIEDGDLSSKD